MNIKNYAKFINYSVFHRWTRPLKKMCFSLSYYRWLINEQSLLSLCSKIWITWKCVMVEVVVFCTPIAGATSQPIIMPSDRLSMIKVVVIWYEIVFKYFLFVSNLYNNTGVHRWRRGDRLSCGCCSLKSVTESQQVLSNWTRHISFPRCVSYVHHLIYFLFFVG